MNKDNSLQYMEESVFADNIPHDKEETGTLKCPHCGNTTWKNVVSNASIEYGVIDFKRSNYGDSEKESFIVVDNEPEIITYDEYLLECNQCKDTLSYDEASELIEF